MRRWKHSLGGRTGPGRKNALLGEALKTYRQGGHADFTAFEQALRTYHRIMSELMTPRKNPFSDYTDELFTMEDWSNIAEVSADTIATEARLFDAVTTAAPDDLKPESFSGTHGMQ